MEGSANVKNSENNIELTEGAKNTEDDIDDDNDVLDIDIEPAIIDNLDISIDEIDPMLPQAWNREIGENSLSEVHGTVNVDSGPNVPWYQKMMSYFGPGTLIAVGYMDPGFFFFFESLHLYL